MKILIGTPIIDRKMYSWEEYVKAIKSIIAPNASDILQCLIVDTSDKMDAIRKEANKEYFAYIHIGIKAEKAMDKVVAARNIIFEYAQSNGYDYVLFIDSDVIVPENCLIRLLGHKAFIASGFYPSMNDYGMPIPNAKMLSKDSKFYIDFPDNLLDGNIHNTDLIGLGCCLVSNQAFIKFRCERDAYGGLMKSEDWCYCEDLRRIGIKIIFDTGLSCKHKIKEQHWKEDEA